LGKTCGGNVLRHESNLKGFGGKAKGGEGEKAPLEDTKNEKGTKGGVPNLRGGKAQSKRRCSKEQRVTKKEKPKGCRHTK